MFSSTEWENCKYSKTVKGKSSYATVLSSEFWAGVTLCLRVFTPLVKVLRMVIDRKSSMGFVYGEIMKARQEIRDALGNCKEAYEPIMDIISSNMKDKLDSQLHLIAYLLNPYYYYNDPQLKHDPVVMDAVVDFPYTLFSVDKDTTLQIVRVELPRYKNKQDFFGWAIAAKACEVNDDTFDPENWWGVFGYSTPHLTKIARRVLSLTTSYPGCETSCIIFEGLHTKKRNRIKGKKFKNLMFVQLNANLMEKNKKKEKNKEVLLADDTSEAEEWIVDPELPLEFKSESVEEIEYEIKIVS